jgi:hypothetical protein
LRRLRLSLDLPSRCHVLRLLPSEVLLLLESERSLMLNRLDVTVRLVIAIVAALQEGRTELTLLSLLYGVGGLALLRIRLLLLLAIVKLGELLKVIGVRVEVDVALRLGGVRRVWLHRSETRPRIDPLHLRPHVEGIPELPLLRNLPLLLLVIRIVAGHLELRRLAMSAQHFPKS